MSAIPNDPRVGPLSKADLGYNYPPGAAGGDDPRLRGTPDTTLLNRNEWYEMLWFCNWFAIHYGNRDRSVAVNAENMIHKYVPGNLRSHAHIADWLVKNWKLYPKV